MGQLYRLYRNELREKKDIEEVEAAENECLMRMSWLIGAYGEAYDDMWGSICEYADSREKRGYFAGFSTAFKMMKDLNLLSEQEVC